MIAQRHCRRCGENTQQEVQKKITASLADFYGWMCLKCNWWTESKSGGIWISKEQLLEHGLRLEDIKIGFIEDAPRCSRCGKRGAEVHHWAPRKIFGDDCEKWPKDTLCVDCHKLWHKLVTPTICS